MLVIESSGNTQRQRYGVFSMIKDFIELENIISIVFLNFVCTLGLWNNF